MLDSSKKGTTLTSPRENLGLRRGLGVILLRSATMRWRSLNVLLGFILSFAFAGLLYGQRAGRGIITGLVSGPAGAAVPDATVTVTGEVSGFKFVVKT